MATQVSSRPFKPHTAGLFAVVIALFFISGFSSLVYQVVWTRMLVFVFGSTTFASSTVLAVFMGGMALGAFTAGRFADRLARPFLWYGILEGIIGLWALAAPFMFDAAIPLYRVIWQQFHLSVLPFSLIRFTVAASILLVPTTCMGATLPLLSRFVSSKLDDVGEKVGTLYSINTLGAVLGASVAGFMLLPAIGLQGTTLIAIVSNLVLTAIVLIASPRYEAGKLLELAPKTAENEAAFKATLPPSAVAAIVAFGVSGAIAMFYEVAWTRSLLMVIGSSTYAFTVMLSTFLIGIFLGSLICARFVDRINNPLKWLAIMQLCVCAGGLLSVHLFNYVPYWNMTINSAFLGNANAALAVRFLLTGMVLLPITLSLGAVFPLVVKTCTTALESVGRSVGSLYSANTLGAICGAFLAGFAVIPLAGAEKTLLYASVTNLVIACGLFWFLNITSKTRVLLSALTLSIGALILVTNQNVWDPLLLMSAQTERRALQSEKTKMPSFDEWSDVLHSRREVLFWEDGACATVGVLKDNNIRWLLTNGHVDASDSFDMGNQILLAGYPIVFRPQAADFAVVGWGSGVTVGTAAASPDAKRVVAIEIEPAVLRAAQFFEHVNLQPDKKTTVASEINDARNYLLATDEKFDVIISEPSNPWQAGVCNLFTTQFFRISRERLKPDGLFCGWLQFEEIAPKDVRHVLAAVHAQYSHILPLVSNGCMMVLASDQPIKLNIAYANKMIQDPALKGQFERVGISDFSDVLSRVICSSEKISELVKGVEPNSDNRNYLEFDVGKTYETTLFVEQNNEWLNESPGALYDSVDWTGIDPARKADLMDQVALSALNSGAPKRAQVWAEESFKVHPNTGALVSLAIINMQAGKLDVAEKYLRDAEAREPQGASVLIRFAVYALSSGRANSARKYLQTVVTSQPTNQVARYFLAKTYTHAGAPTVVGMADEISEDPNQVLKLLAPLVTDKKFVTDHPDLPLMIGTAKFHLNELSASAVDLGNYIRLNPRTVLGWRTLGSVLFAQGNHIGAAQCWAKSMQNAKPLAQVEIRQVKMLIKSKKIDNALTVLKHALQLDPHTPDGWTLLTQLANDGNSEAKKIMIELDPGL